MRQTTLKDYKYRIARVLAHIQGHLDGPLDLSALASVAAFSPYHFHRVFRGMVGETVAEHVRRLRLERAALELVSSDTAVTHLAVAAGYDSHEAFSRAFKSMFGDSPSGFRQRRPATMLRPAPSRVHYNRDGDLSQFVPVEPGGPIMKVEIRRIEEMRVAYLRHVGPYQECGSAWERLMLWAGPKGLMGAGTMCIGLCHDDPEITPPHQIRYDACITVDPGFTTEGEVLVKVIDGGDHAVTTHFGPYTDFGETYSKLMGQWAPRHGRRLRQAPCLEVYLNSPEETEPEDLLTDIYLPLE